MENRELLPPIDKGGENRVLRGGSWANVDPYDLRREQPRFGFRRET